MQQNSSTSGIYTSVSHFLWSASPTVSPIVPLWCGPGSTTVRQRDISCRDMVVEELIGGRCKRDWRPWERVTLCDGGCGDWMDDNNIQFRSASKRRPCVHSKHSVLSRHLSWSHGTSFGVFIIASLSLICVLGCKVVLVGTKGRVSHWNNSRSVVVSLCIWARNGSFNWNVVPLPKECPGRCFCLLGRTGLTCNVTCRTGSSHKHGRQIFWQRYYIWHGNMVRQRLCRTPKYPRRA